MVEENLYPGCEGMSTVPVIASDADLVGQVQRLTQEVCASPPAMQGLGDTDGAVDFLRSELPELFIVDASDEKLDSCAVFEAVRADPWLVDGGILALYDEDGSDECPEHARGANLLAAVPKQRIDRELPRLMGIIDRNRRLLFQRALGPDLVPNVSGRFEVRSDPLEARCYQSLICNFLFNANRIDSDTRDVLSFSMQEMLLNAIEHGNCGITSEQKHEWLESGRSMLDLIAERCRDPEVAKRRVTLEYAIRPDLSRFRIADEGEGFDWRNLSSPIGEEAMLKAHGRGIAMTRGITDTLTFNEKGNEVTFEVAHQKDVASATPGLLEGLKPREVAEGEIIFRQGEEGEFLYFIQRGRYDVLIDGDKVSHMSPDDLFMGEMSFLLRSPRSATVRAQTKGRLVEVSKARFVEAIREKPYYALLLARLLAQRLRRLGKGYPEEEQATPLATGM